MFRKVPSLKERLGQTEHHAFDSLTRSEVTITRRHEHSLRTGRNQFQLPDLQVIPADNREQQKINSILC
ncbi:hypothetical protein DPEC_G00358890 [Dallia pectoralis]|uniref:Uncharacterized protein n=1 Tax=Dallia pectoralis TaxID=75939 RepID=A0ACC2F0D4_DALPE|nr:hypothetical protein DPEC_G00358890 [Dallia pectoralis]